MTLNTQQLGSCNHPLQQHILRNRLQSVSYYLHLRNFHNRIDIVRADKLLSGPFWGHARPATCGVVCAEGAWGTTGTVRSCPTQVQVSLCKGTDMPNSADVHAKVPAMGAGDIWKHSFHTIENMAIHQGHREELTLKGL